MHRVVDISRLSGGKSRPPVGRKEIDGLIAELAGRQHGVVASWQLWALGVGYDAIELRVKRHRLHRVYRGAYSVGYSKISRDGRLMAAVIASGPFAALSHFSAGGHWTVFRDGLVRAHVVTEGPALRGQEGITTHRMRNIAPDDIVLRDGIPVTSLSLTMLHLTGMLSRRSAERVVIRAARLPEFDIEQVSALLDRSNGRRGVRPLRQIIQRDITAEMHALSELELRFLELCRDYGIERPECNQDVAALKVDAVWDRRRALVELDGYQFHRLPRDLRRDNERSRRLVLAGYRILRYAWHDVVGQPTEVAREVKKLLGVR